MKVYIIAQAAVDSYNPQCVCTADMLQECWDREKEKLITEYQRRIDYTEKELAEETHSDLEEVYEYRITEYTEIRDNIRASTPHNPYLETYGDTLTLTEMELETSYDF